MLPSGRYIIKSKENNLCLDANFQMRQFDAALPRIGLSYQNMDPGQTWNVENVGNNRYLLKVFWPGAQTEMALDSNESVKQYESSHPTPFLYHPNPAAPNHRWILEYTGEPNTFYIISEMSGKTLDSNVDGYGAPKQFDHKSKSPFLWTLQRHANNHKWVFQSAGGPYYPPAPTRQDAPPPTQYSSGGGGSDWNSGGSYNQPPPTNY